MRTAQPIRTALLISSFASIVALMGCGTSPAEQQDAMESRMDDVKKEMNEVQAADDRAAWESERNDVLAELRSLRDDIEAGLTRCNERLADKKLKPSERTDETAMQAELLREKTRVEELIARVEGSEPDTWSTVKEQSRTLGAEVKGWWARLKDNIDKKTDADKDKDGH